MYQFHKGTDITAMGHGGWPRSMIIETVVRGQ